MRAGKLQRKVLIEQAVETQDSRGEPIAAWSTFSPWWAEPIFNGGGESQAADQQQHGTAQLGWKGRYLPGVVAKMRLNDNGVFYDIIDVDDTQRRDGKLQLMTTRRAT